MFRVGRLYSDINRPSPHIMHDSIYVYPGQSCRVYIYYSMILYSVEPHPLHTSLPDPKVLTNISSSMHVSSSSFLSRNTIGLFLLVFLFEIQFITYLIYFPRYNDIFPRSSNYFTVLPIHITTCFIPNYGRKFYAST